MSLTDINLMEFLEDTFLKGDVKDEPFIDYNNDTADVIGVSFEYIYTIFILYTTL